MGKNWTINGMVMKWRDESADLHHAYAAIQAAAESLPKLPPECAALLDRKP